VEAKKANSHLSALFAKSRRPRLEVLRRERPLEKGDDSHSLDDDEAEEERARPCDFIGTEVTVLVRGRALNGELQCEPRNRSISTGKI